MMIMTIDDDHDDHEHDHDHDDHDDDYNDDDDDNDDDNGDDGGVDDEDEDSCCECPRCHGRRKGGFAKRFAVECPRCHKLKYPCLLQTENEHCERPVLVPTQYVLCLESYCPDCMSSSAAGTGTLS